MFSKFALLTSAGEMRIAVTAECARPLKLTFGLRSRARKATSLCKSRDRVKDTLRLWNLSYRLHGEYTVRAVSSYLAISDYYSLRAYKEM